MTAVPPAQPDSPPLNKRQAAQHLALGLLAAALTGLLISLLWGHLGLPGQPGMGSMAQDARPWGLGRFAALAGPLMVFLPSLALVALLWLLPRGLDQEQARRLAHLALRLDALTYLTLPVFFALPLLWTNLGSGFAALGLCYLGLVTYKGGLLLHVWWRGFGAAALGPRGHLALWLALFTLLGGLALWTDQAVSTASDEVGYLIFAHSLARHGTLDPAATLAGQEFKAFYWGRWSHDLGFGLDQVRGVLFPLLLAPAYFLGGRLGVMLLYAGLLALIAGQLLAWLRQCGLRPGPAALAAGLTLSSAPVLLYSQQVFPDLPGMLLFLVGLRLLLILPARPWLAGLGLLLAAGLLAGLKSRLAPLSLGLTLAGLAELLAARWGWRRARWLLAGGALAALLVAAWLPAAWWPAGVRVHLDQAAYQMHRTFYALQPLAIFARGLWLDQNFGLLVAAPVFLLALAGLPAGLRFSTRPSLHLLLPALLYLGLICYTRWFQWYGGFAGPGRFLAVVLPPAALFLGLALQSLVRPWRMLLAALPAALGLLYTWLNLLAPQWRFSRPVGVNPLVEALQASLQTPLFHLLPSTFVRSPGLYPWAAVSLGLMGLVGCWAWRQAARGPQAALPAPPAPGQWLPALALALALLGGGFLGLARLAPPAFLEAEHMRGQGSAQYVEYAYPNFMRGMVLLDGQSLKGRLYVSPGQTVLRVVGRADNPGELLLTLDGSQVRWRWEGGRPWQRHIPLGPLKAGYHEVEVGWSSCPDRSCGLLLDRLETCTDQDARRD
ncbi:MAG: hypothetical protein HY910_00205 [Desulfarculus sp.]|nr:hypothetical protein [Desulfarculus sp.]